MQSPSSLNLLKVSDQAGLGALLKSLASLADSTLYIYWWSTCSRWTSTRLATSTHVVVYDGILQTAIAF
jgi:hypothetical protein